MKRLLSLMLTLLLTAGLLLPCAKAEDTVLEPLWHVPDYVQWLLDVARGEIGYKEGPHGYSKYGEWAGDAYAQWCAEFLCWCVDQVDQQHGTELLRNVYPMYSGQNAGRDWAGTVRHPQRKSGELGLPVDEGRRHLHHHRNVHPAARRLGVLHLDEQHGHRPRRHGGILLTGRNGEHHCARHRGKHTRCG